MTHGTKTDAQTKPHFSSPIAQKGKNPAQTKGQVKRARWDSNPRFWAVSESSITCESSPKAHVLVLARLRAQQNPAWPANTYWCACQGRPWNRCEYTSDLCPSSTSSIGETTDNPTEDHPSTCYSSNHHGVLGHRNIVQALDGHRGL